MGKKSFFSSSSTSGDVELTMEVNRLTAELRSRDQVAEELRNQTREKIQLIESREKIQIQLASARERNTLFVGFAAGAALSAVIMYMLLHQGALVGPCRDGECSPCPTCPRCLNRGRGNETPPDGSGGISASSSSEPDVFYSNPASSFAELSPLLQLFSFSNMLFTAGSGIILAAYWYQLYKSSRHDVSRAALSAFYAAIFYGAATVLFPRPGSDLVGGCCYCLCSLLVGGAMVCLLEAWDGPRAGGSGSLDWDVQKAGNSFGARHAIYVISMGIPVVVTGARLYQQTRFPLLLALTFVGLYACFMGCVVCTMETMRAEFSAEWTTFAFGVICAAVRVAVIEQGLVGLTPDTLVLLSLTLSGLNCCVPTLPVMLARHVGWSSVQDVLRGVPDLGWADWYVVSIMVTYALLNVGILAATPVIGSIVHIPYILVIFAMLGAVCSAHFVLTLLVILPFGLVAVSLPSALGLVEDPVIRSAFVWLGSPDFFAALVLNAIRLACGATGLVAIATVLAVTKNNITNIHFGQLFAIIGAGVVAATAIELSHGEHFLAAVVYELVAAAAFTTLLVFIFFALGEKNSSGKTDNPSIISTLAVLILSYRLVINGENSVILCSVGALCMGVSLSILYFFDLMANPAGGTAAAPAGTSKISKMKSALRGTSISNIIVGVAASIGVCCISVVHSSTVLAWVGIVGVYAFFASVTLRLTRDWSVLASTVTVIGCLTIYTGLQLDNLMTGEGAAKLINALPAVLQLLSRPVEREQVHAAVTILRLLVTSHFYQ